MHSPEWLLKVFTFKAKSFSQSLKNVSQFVTYGTHSQKHLFMNEHQPARASYQIISVQKS